MASQSDSYPEEYPGCDESRERGSRIGAGGNISVYYVFGDGYRDMFVAIGLLLGSILPTINAAMDGFSPALLTVLNLGFKLFVSLTAYAATAQRNGKMMIFVAILAGVATAAAIYLNFNTFSAWSDASFDSGMLTWVLQSALDTLLYIHVTYFAFVLL